MSSAVRMRFRSGAPIRDAGGLAVTSALGSVLNVLKFFVVPIALTAHQLDILALGLILAINVSQIGGEALANRAVVQPSGPGPERQRRLVAVTGVVVLCAGAVFPGAVASVLAPGQALAASDRDVLGLFCLVAAALLGLWAVAGTAQRRLDFGGLRVINVLPNAALVAGVLLPVVSSAQLDAVAIAMLTAGLGGMAWVYGRGASAPAPARRVRSADTRSAGIVELLLLALATQLNVILLRIATTGLPSGSVGAVYVAVGIVLVPIMVVAGSTTSAMLPRWAAGSTAPADLLRMIVRVSVASSIVAAVVVGVVYAALASSAVNDAVDPPLRDAIASALWPLALGVPIAAAAWVLRGFAIARGSVWPVVTLLSLGAGGVLLARALSSSIEAVAAGYALSPVPWLVGALILLRRGRVVR